MPFTRAASVVEFNIHVQRCVSGGCAGSPFSGRTMLECRVELQKLAGVALRTFLAQEIGRNADDYGRMIWGSKSHQVPNPKFRTRRNNMFITRPHFGLCLSLLTAYHYHIRRPSPLLSVCDGHQQRRVCEDSFSGSLPFAIFVLT